MNASFYAVLCLLCVPAILPQAAAAPYCLQTASLAARQAEHSSHRRPDGRKTKRRLTHVVVPFHYSSKQLQRLVQQSHLWGQYPPCSSSHQHRKSGGGNAGNGGGDVWLIWYLFADPDEGELETLQSIYDEHYARFGHCFAGFAIKSAGLGAREDNPDMSSRRMFEKLLDNSVGLSPPPGHVLNIEPDVFPVQPSWLDRVQRMVETPGRHYWVVGSAYMGGEQFYRDTRWGCVLYHINGNALYDIGSGEYARFYFGKVRPFMDKVMPGPSPYDVDVMRYLLSERHRDVARRVRSKFLYSGFIANWWRRNVTWREIRELLPDAIFVHSGRLVG